jgi:hypothetical protein
MEITGTMEYDLWANVVSRLELRWDHVLDGKNLVAEGADFVNGFPSGYPNFIGNFDRDSVGLYANVIYKF